jgi:hypothetical protein
MSSVHFQFDERAEDAKEMTGMSGVMPEEVIFTNLDEGNVDKLRLIYDYPAPISLYRTFLGSVYGLAGGYPTQLSRPSWIRLEKNDCTEKFDRKYTPLIRRKGGQVEITVVDYIDEPSEPVPVEWRPDISSPIVSVNLTEYIDAIIDASQEHLSVVKKQENAELDERIIHFLEDIKTIRYHLESEGDLSEFHIDPGTPRVQEYLYEKPFVDVSLSYFLVEVGVIRDEIRRLQKQADQPSEKYKQLLSHESKRIQQEAATALISNPDERAIEWLLARRWTDVPDIVVPSFQAVANFQSDDLHTALLETLDFSNHAKIRRAAVKLLEEYPDEQTINKLEEIADGDDDQTVRETARSVLDSIEAE